MDKIDKFLRRLTKKELRAVEFILQSLYTDKIEGLDIKKLKGHSDVYRVRWQDIRIVFRRQTKDMLILEISRRSEKTYRNF